MSQDGLITYNIFLDYANQIQMQLVDDDTELKHSPRSINIKAQHIDDLNMFQCIVVDRQVETKTYNLRGLERSLPSEESVNAASLLANNPDDIINLAHDLNNQNNETK